MSISTKPTVVGIAADACAGKSGFAAGLASVFGPQRAVVVCLDDYRRFTRLERQEARYSRIHPDVYYLDIMAQHLALLREGQAILRPIYNRTNGVFERSVFQEPCEIIIAEGLQSFATPELRSIFDLKIFLAPDEALKTQWKLTRDVDVRRRAEADVRTEMKHWHADSEAFIEPQRKWADMVVRLAAADGKGKSAAVERVSLILRPTLPRPNLTELFSADHAGINISLDRDMGIPVDRLDIPTNAPDAAYLGVQKALWGQIAKKREDVKTAGLGVIIGPRGESQVSSALVIAQLLVALEALAAGAGQ